MEIETGYYQGKAILVTGAAGFIGSSLVRALSRVDCTLICCGRKAGIPEMAVFEHARLINRKIDIQAPSLWDELLESVDIVFHFAAQTSSRFANENPTADLNINLSPVARFVETCLKKGIRPDMVFPGTVTEAGMTQTFPVNESIQDLPITIYDINKLAAENYLGYYATQLGGRAVTLRLANVYGPGPRSGRPDRGILNLMVMKAMEGKSLTVFGDGNYVRDYLFIDDAVKAFLMAGAHLDATSGSHYVVGTGVGHTVREMIETVRDLVEEIVGKSVDVEFIAPPSGISPIEFRHFVADSARFRADSGWAPDFSLEEGISQTITFFLKRQQHP